MHDPPGRGELGRAGQRVRSDAPNAGDDQVAMDEPHDRTRLLDRKLAQWRQLAVAGDAPHALVFDEEHRAVTEQQEVHPREPDGMGEVPTLLARR